MKPKVSPLFCTIAAGLITLTSAHAANLWDGGGTNANWDTKENWDDDNTPAPGADVTFLSGNNSGGTILLNGNRSSGLVTFNNTDASPADTGFSGGVASVWTINTGISKISSQNFTINSSNLGIQLDADGMYINHNNTAGGLTVNAAITGASGSVISINDFTGGNVRTVRIGGNNSNFDGTWVMRRGTLSVDGNAGTALGDAAANTITFQNVAGEGGNSVSLNTGTASTWVNNFVNNNASGSGGEAVTIAFSGGTNSNASLSLTGSFTSGASQNANARLYINAGTSNGTGTSEGRLLISGDWSGYNKGGGLGITLNERGSVIIENASALANSAVGYSIGSTTTATVGSAATGAGLQMSAKLILGSAFTMANTVNFSGTGGNINSFGARHASGTAILSGQLSNEDAEGANVFSQTTGATLRLTGQVSSLDANRALHINRAYTFNDGTGAATATPTGIVELTRATGVSYTGTVTVHNGTLLVNNTTGSGTGTGALTVNSGATLGGTGIIGGATTVTGSIAPGLATGTGKISFGNNLSLSSGSIFEWELAGTPAATVISNETNYASNRGTAYDAVNVTGTLSGSAAIFRIVLDGTQTFANTFWSESRSWTDIFRTGDGTGSANKSSWADIFSGGFQYYNRSGEGGTLAVIAGPASGNFLLSGNTLSYTFVPEPSTALAGLLLTAGLLRRRRA